MIAPEWPAPSSVQAGVTTRDFGDLADEKVRAKLITRSRLGWTRSR